nr:PREDICTED: uncharacterized protein LOC109032570 [Bemisia tabaci]XP_018900322.1 PREDICTED: uncharacterized protein LOC109032570 [Bemisia tabaci]
MVRICHYLLQMRFYSLAKHSSLNFQLLNALNSARAANNISLLCPRYISLAQIKYHIPPRSTKIKKQPVSSVIKKQPVSSVMFQDRFFKYLRENNKFFTVTPITSDDSVKKLMLTEIKEVTSTELPVFISTAIVNGKLTETLKARLDEECLSRLSSFTTDDVLKVVDAWLYIVPHILNNLKFYHEAMPLFDRILSSNDTSLPAFVQTFYYVSLCKDKNLARDIIRKALDKLQSSHSLMRALSLDELVIISVSIFRTSNTISSRALLRTISDGIMTNLQRLMKDDASLVTLIKPLRPAEFYDLKLLDAIAANLSLLKTKSFITKIQVFALFGQSLYPDKDFLQKFADDIGHSLLDLLENKETMDIRIKDVSRFFWSLSFLNVIPQVENLDKEVMEKIEDWILDNQFNESNLHWLISIMCSIFIFNWDYEQLFRRVFDSFSAHQLNVPNHSANFRNLNLLIAGLRIEAPYLVSEDLTSILRPTIAPTAVNHLRTRPVLKDAYKTAWSLTKDHNVTDILCHFNIPHVLILGLTFYTPKRNLLNIEVLDRSNCLLTSNIPHGLMSLKLRLLKQLHEHILIIDSTRLSKDNNFRIMFEKKIREVDGVD